MLKIRVCNTRVPERETRRRCLLWLWCI